MTKELLYTSAPKGLKPGSRGFCTVLSTKGMPAPMASALESLSAYRHVFPPGDPQEPDNPVAYSHLRLTIARDSHHVLSRVADYGLDYSRRTNKIAHHVVLDRAELSPAGPARVLVATNLLRTVWSEEPRLAPPGSVPQVAERPSLRCDAWQSLMGDAGWAGVLAESFLSDPQRQAYLIYEPGMDLLSLIDEAIGLLPPDKRWDVTFSTYFTSLPQNVKCLWRCVLKDSPEANESRRFVRALRIDLTQPLGAPSGGELVEAARTGERPKPKTAAATVFATQEPAVHLEDSETGTEPYRIREGAAAGSHPSRRPPVRQGAATDGAETGSLSNTTKVTIAALVFLVLVGGAAGLVTLFSPDQKEDQTVAKNETEASAPDTPEVDKDETDKPAQEQPRQPKDKTASTAQTQNSEPPERQGSETAGLRTPDTPKPEAGDPKPTPDEPGEKVVRTEPPKNKEAVNSPERKSIETKSNKPPIEKIPEPQESVVIYQDLPQVDEKAASDPTGRSSGEKAWNKPMEIPLNLPEGTAITDFDFHLLKTDKENFGERSRIDKSQDGGVVVEVRDPIQTDMFNSVAIITRDENRLSFQYKVSPRSIPEIPGFLERGLLAVNLDSKEQCYVAFKEPRVVGAPIKRVETSKSPSALIRNQTTPLSWEVNIADKEIPGEYLVGIVLNDIVVETSGGQWRFFRDPDSKQLVLENNAKSLNQLRSSLVSAVENEEIKKAGHKYQHEAYILSTTNDPEAGSVILEFDAFARAEGISRKLFKEVTGGVNKLHDWVTSEGKPYIQNNSVPTPASLSFDELHDKTKVNNYKEYLADLEKLLNAMKTNASKKEQQGGESPVTRIDNGLADLKSAPEVLRDLQSAAEELHSLNKQFEHATIIQLTASRTFPVPDPDGKEPIPVHIKILELKPAKAKPKGKQKDKK